MSSSPNPPNPPSPPTRRSPPSSHTTTHHTHRKRSTSSSSSLTSSSWSIPLTAPAFTPIQEQQERDELPPKELEYLQYELYGYDTYPFHQQEEQVSHPDEDKEDEEEDVLQVEETVEEEEEGWNSSIRGCPRRHSKQQEQQYTPFMKNAIQQVNDYISLQIEETEKEVYLEALQRCPELVKEETNIVMFLRCEHYNIEKTSKRLIEHWKVRKDLFGSDRAFLPMTLFGAMYEDRYNVQVLKGYITQLPNDEHGRPVILLDRVGSTTCPLEDGGYDRDVYLRMLWYVFHTVAIQPQYQTTGYVFILNLKDWDPYKSNDRIGAKMCFVIIRDCIGIRLKAYHATYGSKQTPVKIVEPHIRQLQGKYIRLHLIHHYGTDDDNLSSLRQYGLLKEHLPICIGGLQNQYHHHYWLVIQRDLYESTKLYSRKECVYEYTTISTNKDIITIINPSSSKNNINTMMHNQQEEEEEKKKKAIKDTKKEFQQQEQQQKDMSNTTSSPNHDNKKICMPKETQQQQQQQQQNRLQQQSPTFSFTTTTTTNPMMAMTALQTTTRSHHRPSQQRSTLPMFATVALRHSSAFSSLSSTPSTTTITTSSSTSTRKSKMLETTTVTSVAQQQQRRTPPPGVKRLKRSL